MISKTIVNSVPCDNVFAVIFLNKGIGFCDIFNNQNLGKWFLPWPLAGLITLTPTLIILDITKTLSNYCL